MVKKYRGKLFLILKPPDLSNADKKVEENNSSLIKTASIVLTVTFLVFLLYCPLLYGILDCLKKKKEKIPIPEYSTADCSSHDYSHVS